MYASLNVLSQSEQQLSLDTILAIAGTVVGILGIVAGYIFYRLSIRTKEPYWSIVSNNLIQDNITQLNDLEVKYKRQKVETVTVSKILLWNKGGETIDRLDITEANPLRIKSADDSKLLDAKVVASNKVSNRFSVEFQREANQALIQFAYLDKLEGGIIQVVHTGKSSKSLEIVGDIKGAKPIRKFNIKRRSAYLSVLGSMLSGIVFLIIYNFTPSFGFPGLDVILASSLISLVAFIGTGIYRRYATWFNKVFGPFPKEFSDFNQDEPVRFDLLAG